MLNDIIRLMDEADNHYNVADMKIMAYVENAEATFSINCKKAELKVMQESGTMEDLNYFQEEAESDAVGKLKKAVEKIIENIKTWINEVKLKILSLITKAETTKQVDEIEKRIKFNPFVKQKKVEVENTKEQLKVVAWAQGEYQKLLSKIRSGKEVTTEEVDAVDDTFRSKIKNAGSVSAAMHITVGAAVDGLKKAGNSMGENIEKARKVGVGILDEAKELGGKLHMEMSSALTSISNKVASVTKEGINVIVSEWKNLLIAIRSAVSKIKGNTADTTEESVLDSMAEEMFTVDHTPEYSRESASDILDDIENNLFGESYAYDDTTVEESATGSFFDDFMTANFDFN